MTPIERRLAWLEDMLEMVVSGLAISHERIDWLIRQATRDASNEELNTLELAELRLITDTADYGTGMAQEAARQGLERAGLAAPDVAPLEAKA